MMKNNYFNNVHLFPSSVQRVDKCSDDKVNSMLSIHRCFQLMSVSCTSLILILPLRITAVFCCGDNVIVGHC